MRLVETIAGELLHQVENVHRNLLTHPARHRTADEHRALLRHLFGALLAHRAPQQVGAAERIARQHLRDLHHLLLVKDHPVGGLEDRLEARMQVIDRAVAPAVLAVDEIIHHAGLQRAGPEQRHQRHDVLEAIRLQAADEILHATRLELENGSGAAGLEQRVGRRVIHGQRAHRERWRLRRPRAVDECRGALDDGERAQPQEVELHQPRRLDIVLVELGDDAAAGRIAVQRREVGQHRGGDHDTPGVHAGVAGQAFERARQLDEVSDLVLALVQALELRLLLQRAIERDAELEGNELGDAIDVAVGHAEHAADVAHYGLRRHGAVGDDLRHALAPVLFRDVIDHPVAAVHAEVDVEIGHRDALGIQEALEQQVVLERIEVGNPQAVGHERARSRAAARTDRHAVLARPADEIGDDEKVAREAHLADDFQLALQALAVSRRRAHRRREACGESARGFSAQEFLGAHARGQRILRQAHLPECQRQTATARDLHGVGQRLRHVGEQRRHLLRRAQVLLARVAAHAAGVREQRAVVNADARLVRFELLGFEEPHVVGRHHRGAAAAGERDRAGNVGLLERPAEALQLEVEASGKQREPRIECTLGVGLAGMNQRAADVALGCAGQADQALEMSGRQPAALDARRAALLPLEVRTADQPRQVAVAARRLAQQREARRGLPLAFLVDQQVHPHQRLDARLERLAIELHHREEIALVGHRDCRHARGRHCRDQLRHSHHAVAEGVFGVQPQMNETV